ncbi:putative gpi mannosyltransferase [Phaeomoniella chlamydospora]|uniref:GPI mannosyltransferase 1 n=1 Tax=Phaeomoniella chlamydospora TaxID=158046 RepID=A0A0G2E6L6_PHACM|nr:putative gpi mannosyltransferase [Phaeomoniella chlamydospora]
MDLVPDFSLFKPPPITKSLLTSASSLFAAAISLRVVLLVYGLYQDVHSPLKYTDVDYFVFTDAARYLSRGQSPYMRATYRYTPLLAWMLLPTTWGNAWFHSGKALFAISDIVAGYLILYMLRKRGFQERQALVYSSIWLLNPMVATISTRGSSEGLLCVIVVALLWAASEGNVPLAGMLLGFGVHFKIYPFIYGPSILWTLSSEGSMGLKASFIEKSLHFLNPRRVLLVFSALFTFTFLNLVMYFLYGDSFILHTYLHHLVRIDHRHNFSPYNTLLYLSSAGYTSQSSFESLAFLPQLLLSVVAIPLILAKKNLAACMLAQTIAFVTFNKVCTSQYFLWYLIFLPLYLPNSRLIREPRVGFTALLLWIASQALWLQQGYKLEFLGDSAFVPGLWLASLSFFGINVWILGVIVQDVRNSSSDDEVTKQSTQEPLKSKEGEDEVEEIIREESIENMVRREKRLGRQEKANLQAYMSDLQTFL